MDRSGAAGLDAIHGLMGPPDPLTDAEREQQAQEERRETEACMGDLKCWAVRHMTKANLACTPLIESLARFDHEWTTGLAGPTKFAHYEWTDHPGRELSYWGREVKFQNGFGAWQRMTYWCNYDPGTGRPAWRCSVRAVRVVAILTALTLCTPAYAGDHRLIEGREPRRLQAETGVEPLNRFRRQHIAVNCTCFDNVVAPVWRNQ